MFSIITLIVNMLKDALVNFVFLLYMINYIRKLSVFYLSMKIDGFNGMSSSSKLRH